MKNSVKNLVIALLVVVYMIAPDLLPGPVDDLIIAAVGVISAMSTDKEKNKKKDPDKLPEA